ETLGAGGYIDRAEKKGAQVTIVVVTDGNKHGLKVIRHQEEVKAVALLGVHEDQIIFLDYPDGQLRQFKDDFTLKLDQIMVDFGPTVVLGTHPADIHPDHAVVGEVIDATTGKLIHKPLLYQFLVHYHRYPRPEGFHPISYLLPPVKLISTDNPWQKFTLTNEEQNDKNEAVLQYKTQLAHKNPFLRGLLFSFVRRNELYVIVRPQ
ncbi:PIG-L family deacetylase, partial [Candidatus Berkelbacteria bacterium]|nr:PIG-L family deacetylase [Candidatus Berkelbacteria bacterium]